MISMPLIRQEGCSLKNLDDCSVKRLCLEEEPIDLVRYPYSSGFCSNSIFVEGSVTSFDGLSTFYDYFRSPKKAEALFKSISSSTEP